MKISEILDQIGSDVLTKETKALLSDAFNEAVETQIKERVELAQSNSLQQLDEAHANQLSQLLEALDKDHTTKLQSVMRKIDEDHTEKLEYLVRKQQVELKEDASTFKAQLVKQLSNYIDLYLEDAIPKQEIMEAVSNKQAQKTLNEIKQLVAIDEEFVSDTIREAVIDGKKQIDNLKEQLNEAVKQNIRINQNLKTTKADLLIEQSTMGFSKAKKAYVLRILKNKDPEYITENFEYVVKMFDTEDGQNRDLLAEEAKKKTNVVKEKIDTQKVTKQESELITEDNQTGNKVVTEYLGALQKQDGK